MTAWQVAEGIKRQDFTAEEYAVEIFRKIAEKDKLLHAYITVLRDHALEQAKALDQRITQGERTRKLSGVCVAVKDNMCSKGIETTCGSRILKGFLPPYDSTVVTRIREEDAVISGKTNLDEFAMGSSTEYSCYGPTRNPIDPALVPGGSSGGSAAAVASGEATIALGSDTGGSIRCPAAFCSLVGLKPTYGLVSRYGLIAYANSFDQIGPIAKCVRDAALMLDVIAGYDPLDSTSTASKKPDYEQLPPTSFESLKIGVAKEFFGPGTDERVSRTIWRVLDKAVAEGASLEEFTWKNLEYSLPVYYIIAMSEASSNLARYDGLRYGSNVGGTSVNWDLAFAKTRSAGFGLEVKRRIILGTFALSAGYHEEYYLRAQKIRALLARDFNAYFKRFDVLASPTMPVLPFKIGEKIKDPLQMYLCDLDTVPANLTGVPAISLPAGAERGLPVGIQFMAPPFREDILLQVGSVIEQLTHRSFDN